jgi:subtilase family serine protease
VLLGGCGATQLPSGAPGAAEWQALHLARATCPQLVGKPTCLTLEVLNDGITPLCSPSSSCGFTPQQLEQAYNITSQLGKGKGTNVAVIEAGDLPNASSDLATYRSQYGLGKTHLTKYNEYGRQSDYPPTCENYGWCLESALDIDMVSASCPKCNIFLVEAKGGISDFEQAEKEGVALGATILSNSWICYGSWDCDDSNFPNYFDTPGIAYLASSGDAGYDNIGGPSVLATVIAVGGTQLTLNGSKYSETLWNDAGSGCASSTEVGAPGVPKPPWQHDPDCSYRTINDVSSESGCSPGVAVYVNEYGGWTGVCGTSVAAPFTAGVVGLAGNADKMNGAATIWELTSKQHKKYFHHPGTGSGGSCGNYLCGYGEYKKYYTGPGGWGTPNGTKGY